MQGSRRKCIGRGDSGTRYRRYPPALFSAWYGGVCRSGWRHVFSSGFGLRDIERELPFSTDTISLVASVTKSFTACLVGMLVDEGLLDWERPVRDYLPGFDMLDPLAAEGLTLEDMLCHRSGLPNHENLLAHGVNRELPDAEKAKAWRRELVNRLAYFEPGAPFRARFQYQDIVYTCVGALLEEVTGDHYEQLIKDRLLDPLQMTSSTFSRAEARATQKLCEGYDLCSDQPEPMPFCDTRYLAPTAGLYSTAEDMIKWIQFQMQSGLAGDCRLVSEPSMEWLHSPHMIDTESVILYGDKRPSYGQGWMLHKFRGLDAISHGGTFNGHRTNVSFIPEKKLGVVVLSNLNLCRAAQAASLVALDHYLGRSTRNEWIDYYQDVQARSAAARSSALDALLAAANTEKSAQLSATGLCW